MTARNAVAIVGGGIVGLATALALTRRGRTPLVVLEAEGAIARHQTGRNSGVIHSGLYYKPQSLKAQMCGTGREALYRFCAEHDVPHERCGKLVVATRPEDVALLDLLEERGRANGLKDLTRLGPAGIREREPEAVGLRGLWVEETGIVDFAQVAATYARLVETGGGEVRTGARVVAVAQEPGGLCLETTTGVVRANFVVGCAGLQADRVAGLCGLATDIRLVAFRGDYYELRPERRNLVQGLIYPVPDPTLPFLGVHFTRRIDGRIEMGPNAVLALHREGYGRGAVSLRDIWDTVAFPGFWRLARRYWRTGLAEYRRAWSKEAFVRSLQRLVPSITAADVEPCSSGIRAQALDLKGQLLDDFHVVPGTRMLHVLNAPSPAATASLSIGERIADLVSQSVG